MVDSATAKLQGIIKQTALDYSERLSKTTGSPVYLKREDQQVCRSFKSRGAYNRMSHLSPIEREHGIVCASAGNHAQGVANACKKLEIRGTIYLPSTAPRQKRDRIAAIGGPWVELKYVDGAFDQTQQVALNDSISTNRTYIHPYDDPLVIAGQGSIATELAQQLGENLENVIIPVGGGGLISGMAAWLRDRTKARIIGVESAGAASAYAARQVGEPVSLSRLDSFVDGTAVGRTGDVTFAVMNGLVDELVTVPEGAVCAEMLNLYHTEGIIAEPSGALASSALVAAASGRIADLDLKGTTVAIVSGGNNDLSRYAEVVERAMQYQGIRHYFLVTFPQQPGALRHFLDQILGQNDDIVYFEYTKKNNRDTGPALVGIDISDPDDLPGLLDRMEQSPIHTEPVPANSDLLRFLI